MLTKWLPTTASTIPENLLYNVGVGAFVLNDKNEMLLVKEASGVTKGLVKSSQLLKNSNDQNKNGVNKLFPRYHQYLEK